MKRPVAFVLGLVLLGTVPASAHHSLAMYIRTNYKTVEGTVKEFSWSNPHARLALVVEGQDGVIKEWNFEGGSVNRLISRGFTRNSVTPGDKVTVAYNPKRDGGIGGFFLAVTMRDGRVYGAESLKTFNKGD